MRKTNGYGWYTAEYCRSTGLPMYDKKSYADVSNKYLSKTRCAKIKKPVKDGEKPVAFYRVDRGYCGLYLRAKDNTYVADRIRAMVATDEDLCELIHKLGDKGLDISCYYCHGDNGCIDSEGDIHCSDATEKACILAWLHGHSDFEK